MRNLLAAVFALVVSLFATSEARAQKCPSDCSNRGICQLGQCFCQAGFGGVDCSGELSCPASCGDHGACKFGRCYCDPGFEGDHCETKTDCGSGCSGNGVCRFGQCFCKPGYVGRACESKPACPSDCSGHGQCFYGKCFCAPYYSGDDCGKPPADRVIGTSASYFATVSLARGGVVVANHMCQHDIMCKQSVFIPTGDATAALYEAQIEEAGFVPGRAFMEMGGASVQFVVRASSRTGGSVVLRSPPIPGSALAGKARSINGFAEVEYPGDKKADHRLRELAALAECASGDESSAFARGEGDLASVAAALPAPIAATAYTQASPNVGKLKFRCYK